MMEIYKDIEGYEGLYQVSNLGNVKSLRFGKEKILKPIKLQNGYLCVGLYKQGYGKTYLVHRLVAQVFIPNPNNLPEINHKDEQKTNNCVHNLEYCDRLYNINYGTRNQRISKKVQCIETGVVYPSAHQVQRQLGFDYSHISKCCRGEYKTCGGYTWRYVS